MLSGLFQSVALIYIFTYLSSQPNFFGNSEINAISLPHRELKLSVTAILQKAPVLPCNWPLHLQIAIPHPSKPPAYSAFLKSWANIAPYTRRICA